MQHRPDSADATLIHALRAEYGFEVAALDRLPLGNDSDSAVYRVETFDGASYLLKLRTASAFSAASLAVPRYLAQLGIPHVLAPLSTTAGDLWATVGDYVLSLHPFVEGRAGADGGLSPAQWRALGETVQQVHAVDLPRDIASLVPQETFIPSRRAVIDELEAAIAHGSFAGRSQRELGAVWQEHEADIQVLLRRAGELGRELRERGLPHVLCHADLHTWNVLAGAGEELWIVDWDETVLAPKERDLMFVVGGIGGDGVSSATAASFIAGYGGVDIDPVALAYYRFAWAVQDIAAFGERVFFAPGLREQDRREALRGFEELFAARRIVEIALGTEGAA